MYLLLTMANSPCGMTSTLSLGCSDPACIVPVTDRPLPIPLNMSVTHILNGLSTGRSGGMNWSAKIWCMIKGNQSKIKSHHHANMILMSYIHDLN